jgi:hypothetical protein
VLFHSHRQVSFPTLTSKEVSAEVKAIKQKCRDAGEQEKDAFALLERINVHMIKTVVAPGFFASTMYGDYTNTLGLYQIRNMNVARAIYPPVVMLDTLFADFKMEMEIGTGTAADYDAERESLFLILIFVLVSILWPFISILVYCPVLFLSSAFPFLT